MRRDPPRKSAGSKKRLFPSLLLFSIRDILNGCQIVGPGPSVVLLDVSLVL